MSQNAKLIIISGPSGVGKGTIAKAVSQSLDIPVSVSVTTRNLGNGEVEGKDYYFISKDKFDQMLKDNELLEYAEVFSNFYGTPKPKIQELLDSGKSVILEIDTQGGEKVRSVYPDAVMIFILPPNLRVLEARMNGRGRDSDEDTKKQRLENASNEIAQAWRFYEHMVINEKLENAIEEVQNIIKEKTGDN